MLLLTASSRKLTLALSLIGLTTFYSTQAQAKRYVNAKDDEVEYTLNTGRAEKYTIDKEKIKVLVWNLFKGEKKSFVKDFKAITADKDILLLQEVITDKRMEGVMTEDMKRTYHIATSFFDTEKNWARSGAATASKYHPVEVDWQRSYYREPVLNTAKMISIAKFDLANSAQDLMTLSIHGVNFVSASKLRNQLRHAARLIQAHKGPVIFGGDFNTWTDKKTEYMRTTLRDVGLEEVPFEKGRMETLGKPLDYIFTRGLKVHYSKVYKEIEGSDHKALEVEVSLP